MQKIEGYDKAQAMTGEYEKLEAGGYICRIINAKEEKSNSGRSMLVIAFDIDEGEKAGFYQRRFDNDTRSDRKWQGVYRQLLDGEKSAGYLKGVMTSLEVSNNGFKWDWNESKLKGLKFGGVFGEEEYEYNGEIKTAVKVKWIRSVDKIRNGDFEIPEIKKLPVNNSSYAMTPVLNDDEIPF